MTNFDFSSCVTYFRYGSVLVDIKRGEHSKGLSNQAGVELDMINAKSAADIAFTIMSSSQAIVN